MTADLEQIRGELAAIGALGDGHLRRFTDAWASVGRHVPALVEEIEQLRTLVRGVALYGTGYTYEVDGAQRQVLNPTGVTVFFAAVAPQTDLERRHELAELRVEVEQLRAERDESRARANEAARLSAEARDHADDLRKKIADQSEQIANLERDRLDRDAWAVNVAIENNLYELPLDVEDEYGAIAARLKAYRTDMATEVEFGAKAVRVRDQMFHEVEQLRIERDDNRTEIADLQERLARADTTSGRPLPDERIADLTSDEVVGIAFDARTGHYWQHQKGKPLPNCNTCGLWMTDWSLVNDCVGR